MRDTRRGKIGLLVGVMMLVGAIIVPGAVAQSETMTTPIGTLRLHLDGTQRYFNWDEFALTGTDYQQSITVAASCQVTGFSPATPELVKLAGGTTSTSNPTLNNVGLANNGLGVRFLNCGRVDAPNWALRLTLGSYIKGLGPGTVGIGSADLDLQGWGGVTAVANLFFQNAPVACPAAVCEKFISGNGARARMSITGTLLFDEIRLRPKAAFDAVALRGGGGSFGDTVFNVVSETNAPELSITKSAGPSPISVGDDATFDIEVTNASGAGTASGVGVLDDLPDELAWSIESQGLNGATDGNACPTDLSGGSLICTIEELTGGSSYKVTIKATTSAAGTVTNELATVSLNDLPVDTDGPESIVVQGAGLNVMKEADADTVVAESSLGFTITVSNNGPGNANNVSATDVLPTDTDLVWSIESQGLNGATNGSACPTDLSGGSLICTIGTLGVGDAYTVHITSPTTAATVNDSPVVNEATADATGVTTQSSGLVSITIFAGTLDCNEPEPEVQGGGTTPLNELARLDNVGGGCGALIPFTLDSSVGADCDLVDPEGAQCVLLQKDLLGQAAQFYWSVTWLPETADYPETATVFDFDLDGDYEPIQFCLGDTDNDGFPNLPSGDPWCVVSTSVELQVGGVNDGLVVVSETYYGSGDPGGKRH